MNPSKKIAVGTVFVLMVACSANAFDFWDQAEVADPEGWASFTSMVVLPSGDPALVYHEGWPSRELIYAEYRDGVWHSTVVDDGGGVDVGQFCSLAVVSGYPAVSYYDSYNGALKYARYDVELESWQAETVDAGSNGVQVGMYTSLAVDPAGYPGIAYLDTTDSQNHLVKYAWYDGIGWSTETVAGIGSSYTETSLVYLSLSEPAIAYVDGSVGEVRYAQKLYGGGWSIETVDSMTPTANAGTVSMALLTLPVPAFGGGGDTPIIAYAGVNSVLKCARPDEGWHPIELDSDPVADVNLCIDEAGTSLSLSYVVLDMVGSTRFARLDMVGEGGLEFSRVTGVVNDNSLALLPSGDPVIAYSFEGDVMLAQPRALEPLPVEWDVSYLCTATTTFGGSTVEFGGSAHNEGEGGGYLKGKSSYSAFESSDVSLDGTSGGHFRGLIGLFGQDGLECWDECIEWDPETEDCIAWAEMCEPAYASEGAGGSIVGSISIGGSPALRDGEPLTLQLGVAVDGWLSVGAEANEQYSLRLYRGEELIAELTNANKAESLDVTVVVGEALTFEATASEFDSEVDGEGYSRVFDFQFALQPHSSPDDLDGDGVLNDDDNCPVDFNPGQEDCDSNGIGDACQGIGDCNGNGVPDNCDIAEGSSLDCQPNGVPDECETKQNVAEQSGQLSPFYYGMSQTYVIEDAPAASSAVTFYFRSMADLSSSEENVAVYVNNVYVGYVFAETSSDCAYAEEQLVVDASVFNDAVAGGDAVILLEPTSAVDDFCSPSYIEIDVSYVSVDDCNGNGTPDDCDVMYGTSEDCDGNLVPDECDPDCNTNGVADGCDIIAGVSVDCNENNVPDECDIEEGTAFDCNGNDVPDVCDVDPSDPDGDGHISVDCQPNDVPDECEIESKSVSLLQIERRLEQNYSGIVGFIDDRYDFVYDSDGYNIRTGGQQMYSDGNILVTEQAWGIPYTHGQVLDGDGYFGTGSSYFTGEYAGLFVLGVADASISILEIAGQTGAYGNGVVVGDSFSVTAGGREFAVFAKRSYGMYSPSVNHLIIVPGDKLGLEHYWSDYTGDEGHQVYNLESRREVYFLVVSREGGLFLSDEDMLEVVSRFLANVVAGAGDCNGNGIPDDCDVASGFSEDLNNNGIPDECDTDCNTNGVPDDLDIAAGADDCNENGVPDECDLDQAAVMSAKASFDSVTPGDPPAGYPVKLADVADWGMVYEVQLVADGTFETGSGRWTESHVGGHRGAPGNIVEAGSWDGEVLGSLWSLTGLTLVEARYVGGSVGEGEVIYETDYAGGTLVVAGSVLESVGDYVAQVDAVFVTRQQFEGGEFVYATTEIKLEGVFDGYHDRNGNSVPDECEDCNGNGIPDDLEISEGWAEDCNSNGVPDGCDLGEFGDVFSVQRWESMLFALDLNAGQMEYLSSLNPQGSSQGVSGAYGLAVQPGTGVLYAIVATGGGEKVDGDLLVQIDGEYGDVTVIGEPSEKISDIAFGADGTLYGVTGNRNGMSGRIFTLSLADATAMYTGVAGGAGGAQAIAFSPANGLLYHVYEADGSEPVVSSEMPASNWVVSGSEDKAKGARSVSSQLDRDSRGVVRDSIDAESLALRAGYTGGVLETIDVSTGQVNVIASDLNPTEFNCLAFAPSGSPLIGFNYSMCYRIDPRTGATEYMFDAYTSTVTGVAFAGTATSMDCNANGIPDECDLSSGSSIDCNGNNIPDECETDCNKNGIADECDLASGTSEDCNGNNVPDECDIEQEGGDCNTNGVPDECDVISGYSEDCNGNEVPDECDIGPGGSESDCNENDIPDSCDLASGLSDDCNTNGVPDECDLFPGVDIEATITSLNDNHTSISSVIPNRFDFTDGYTGTYISDGGLDMYDGGNELNTDLASLIPYTNGVITDGASAFGGGSRYFTAKYTGLFVMLAQDVDINTFEITGNNGADGHGSAEGGTLHVTVKGEAYSVFFKRVFNAYDPSINHIIIIPGDGVGVGHNWDTNTDNDYDSVTGLNGISEIYYVLVASQSGQRLTDDEIVVIAEAFLNQIVRGSGDCNENGVPDDCDIDDGVSTDIDENDVPDECQPDCNENNIPDSMEIALGSAEDCDSNEVLDECEMAAGTGTDCNSNSIMDACDIIEGTSTDCNINKMPDECDIASGYSEDCQPNGVPDECDIVGGGFNTCEDIRVGSGGSAPSGYYTIYPDGETPVNAYCNMTADRGWTIIDPYYDSGWGQFFAAWDSYENGAIRGWGSSYETWRDWFELSNAETIFAVSEDCQNVGDDGTVYRMTGNYYGCYWYNNNCSFDGECHQCAGYGSQISWGKCPWIVSGPDTDYDHNCSYDWWNHAPSIGANGTHCVAYVAFTGAGGSADCNTNGVPDECDWIQPLRLTAEGTFDGFAGIPPGGYPEIEPGASTADWGAVSSAVLVLDEARTPMDGRWTESHVGGHAGASGNVVAAGSWDGSELGTQWSLDDLTLVEATLVSGSPGEGQAVYETTYEGGDLTVNGSMWGSQGTHSAEVEAIFTTTHIYVNGELVDASTQIEMTGEFAEFGDCNTNGVLDECDINSGFSNDCNTNGIPDECEVDGNLSADCNQNGIPDVCELGVTATDCNGNGVLDECDLADGTSLDCNSNSMPDECDIAGVTSSDCNGNRIPDECELQDGSGADCNQTGILDECEIAAGSSKDCNINEVPDECEISDARVIRISQESAAGLGDFADNVVGLITPYHSDSTAVDYYRYDQGLGSSFNGVAPALVEGRSHLFFVDGTDGLSLVMVHGAPNSAGGGGCSTHVSLFGDADGMAIGLRDDSSDSYSGDGVTFAISHGWDSCCTDGVVFTGIAWDSSLEVYFTAEPSGLDSWAAYSTTGREFPLELMSDRRILLEVVPAVDGNDCNGNSMPDDCDISSGVSQDINTNGVPDECELPPVAKAGGPYVFDATTVNVTLDAMASYDPDGVDPGFAGIETVQWDLGNDGIGDDTDRTNANEVIARDIAVAKGLGIGSPIEVVLTVVDKDGWSASDVTEISYTNSAPTADAGGPYGPLGVGDTVQLNGVVDDPDIAVGTAFDSLTVEWDYSAAADASEIGDGFALTASSEISYTTLFDVLGDGVHTIHLNVHDSAGLLATASAEVELLPPDLEVTSCSGPDQADANGSITVQWRVTNVGGRDVEGTWTDRVYLSADDQPGDDIELAGHTVDGPLARGTFYDASEVVTIPEELFGTHWLIVVTDADGDVVELNAEGNNVTVCGSLAVRDTSVPETTIVSGPAEGQHINTTGVTFAWTGSDNATATENLEYAYCLEPASGGCDLTVFVSDTAVELDGLTEEDSPYTFRVVARDEEGNVDASSAERSFSVDLTPLSVVDFSPTGTITDQVYDLFVTFSEEAVDFGISKVTVVDTNGVGIPVTWSTSAGVNAYQLRIPTQTTLGRYEVTIGPDIHDVAGNAMAAPFVGHFEIALADLAPIVLDIPTNGFAGSAIQIGWTVRNDGTNAATGTWTDLVYLSTDEVFGGDRYIGGVSNEGPLAPGATYERIRALNLPPLVAGDYWVIVYADRYNNVREPESQEGLANTIVSAQQIHVTIPPYPDLQVTNVQPPTQAIAGQTITLEWTVQNNGDGATTAPFWYEDVYLSLDQEVNHGDHYLGRFTNVSTLAGNGDSYIQSVELAIPSIAPGCYYFLVKTDVGGNQYEYNSITGENAETNNLLSSDPCTPVVLPPPTDLQIVADSVLAPDSGVSDQPIMVSWTVINDGESPTAVSYWLDAVYLSEDDVLDSEDVRICTEAHNGVLLSGESYSASTTCTLPRWIEGDHYVFVLTDSSNHVDEQGFEGNNSDYDHTVIDITLTPPPDLVVWDVIVPDTAGSGQEVTVEWTVENDGFEPTEESSWHDAVYLSEDESFETLGDNVLIGGPYEHTGVLQAYPSEPYSYSRTETVTIPHCASNGVSYLFVVTDVEDEVEEYFEELETNNAGAQPGETPEYLDVSLTEADLAASDLLVPSNGFSSQPISLSWNVENLGNTSTGVGFVDRVYLSADEQLDTEDDTLLATFEREALVAGGSFVASESVTLPRGISGDYFILVHTDGNGAIPECGMEANNVARGAAVVHVSFTEPDLVVSEVQVDSNGFSGSPLNVVWTVKNQGDRETTASSWLDVVYVSSDTYFDVVDDPSLGTFQHDGDLDSGEEYTREETVILPPALAGTYYLFVATDTTNAVIEPQAESNNVSIAEFNVTALEPDLSISNVSAIPVSGDTGDWVDVSWHVENVGERATSETGWVDQVYVSADTAFDSSDIWLGDFDHVGQLDVGSGYTGSGSVELAAPATGEYYILVRTDGKDHVYELGRESNNYGHDPAGIHVNCIEPDLIVESISGAASASSGFDYAITWTVANVGELPTGFQRVWRDAVYLSDDPTLNVHSDVALGLYLWSNPLDAGTNGNSYTRTESITLPSGIEGPHYIFVVTDFNNGVLECGGDANNTSDPFAINVDLSMVDLQVADVTVPATAFAGQEATIEWQVINNGTSSTPENLWNDKIYLSLDEFLDDGDIYIGYIKHNGTLGVGETYTASETITIPAETTGNYHVIVEADALRQVYEHDAEDNNEGSSGGDLIDIQIPPPADLVVTNVAAPLTITPGQQATFDWTVSNEGENIALGSWYDSIYLSTDQAWDLQDRLVAKVKHTGSVASGASYTGHTSAIVPGVVPAPHYVLVRTDIHNQVPEVDNGNNLGASDSPTDVQIVELELGVEFGAQFLCSGLAHFYRVTVPANETLLVTLDGQYDAGANELYILYGEIPNRGYFDDSHDNPFVPDQQVRIPTTEAGTYYIMVYGDYVPDAPQNYTILAESLPFGITEVKPVSAANTSEVTIEITGARFEPETAFGIITVDDVELEPLVVYPQDRSQAYATFDLAGTTAGLADPKAVNPDAEVSIAEGLFEITEGGGPQLSARIVAPAAFRTGRVFEVRVEYANIGDSDVPAPLFELFGSQFIQTKLDLNDLWEDGARQILGVNFDGPAGILPPGAFGSISIFVRSFDEGTLSLGVYRQSSGVPIDWDSLESRHRPADASPYQWEVVWQRVRDYVGETHLDLERALGEVATRLWQRGRIVYDIDELFGEIVEMGWEAYPSVLAGMIVDEDTMLPLEDVLVVARSMATDANSNAMVISQSISDVDGEFEMRVSGGDYALYADGYYFDPAVTVDVPSYRDVRGLVLYAKAIPNMVEPDDPAEVPDTSPSIVTDGNGDVHLVWQRGEEVYHAVHDGADWNDVGRVADTNGIQPRVTKGPSGAGNDAITVVWRDGFGNDSDLLYTVGMPSDPGPGYSWTMLEPVTNDSYMDEAPALAFVVGDQLLIVWQKKNDDITDDTELYWSLMDTTGYGRPSRLIRPRRVLDNAFDLSDGMSFANGLGNSYETNGLRDSEWCYEVELAAGTKLPKWIPVIGGKYGYSVSSELCATIGCELSLGGSVSMELDISENLSGSGNVGVSAHWVIGEEVCMYSFDRAELTGGIGLSGSIGTGPMPTSIPGVTVEIGSGLSGQLQATLIWKAANFPGWPSDGYLDLTLGADPYGEVSFIGLATARLDGQGRVTVRYRPPSQFKVDNYCLLVKAEAKVWGYVVGSLCKTWGGCDDYDISCDDKRLKWLANPRSLQTTRGYMRDGVPVTEDFVLAVEEWSGTGQIYDGATVLADVSSDFKNDGKPSVAVVAPNKTLAAWSKDAADPHVSMGSALVVAEFDGVAWGGPVEVESTDYFNMDPNVIVDGTGTPMLVWSRASAKTLDIATSTAEEILNASEAGDVYYSIQTNGVWTDPAAVAELSGTDRSVVAAAAGANEAFAAWLHTEPDETVSVYASIWDGSQWSTPDVVSGVNDCQKVTVAYVQGNPMVVWEADTDGDLETTLDRTLFHSIYSGASWLSPVAMPKEEVFTFDSVTQPPRGMKGITLPHPLDECCCLTDAECDDEIDCTEDKCINLKCQNEPKDDICDDGAFCNGVETCDSAEGCQPGEEQCTGDGEFCNEDKDRCDVCATDAECDDSVSCTTDTCVEGQCSNVDDGSCDNGVFCDGQEYCDADAGGCANGAPPCPPASTCDEEAKKCKCDVDGDCNDNNVCNGTEYCGSDGYCASNNDPLVCDDNNVCDGAETCDPTSGCVEGTPLSCNDGDPCNGSETCDPVSGCVNGTPPDCDDNDPCTSDFCEPSVGCRHESLDCGNTEIVRPKDPNEKIGPAGYGDENWVAGGQNLMYTILFENVPEATASAQVVTITDQLSEDLDWRTFRLGDVGWGDTYVDIPDGRSVIQHDVDMIASNGVIVRINAGIDFQTGEAKWTLTSIDPETGELPQDATLGFLPPNNPDVHDGEGFVKFTIQPLRTVETGTVITNDATIVFDVNEPIDTNEVSNTIDVDPPTSAVDPLDAEVDGAEIQLSWSGEDAEGGSGLAGYAIFVSMDGGPFEEFLSGTAETSGVYVGVPGHSYAFYSVASDNAGNTESHPDEPDAVTSVLPIEDIAVDLVLDHQWLYQNLPSQAGCGLTARINSIDDPQENSGYTYTWEFVLPGDVAVAPSTVSGGGAGDMTWLFSAPDCNAGGLSDSGTPHKVRVTVVGNEHANYGSAELEFGICLLGDVNNDTYVDVADREIVNTFWQTGVADGFSLRDCDVNCDGVVNVADRAIVHSIWRGGACTNSVSAACPLRSAGQTHSNQDHALETPVRVNRMAHDQLVPLNRSERLSR